MKSLLISAVLASLFLGCSSSEEEVVTKAASSESRVMMQNSLYYTTCDGVDNQCIDEGEIVELTPSYAYVDVNSDELVIKVRGWVYESDANFATRFSFLTLLSAAIGQINSEPSDIEARIDPFLSESKENQLISVQIGTHYYDLSPSSGSGNFEDEVRLASAEVDALREEGILGDTVSYRVLLGRSDKRQITSDVKIIPNDTTVVISDIDDTIKVSEVYVSKEKLLENTFFKAPRAVESMLELFGQFEASHGVLNYMYVSGSPKQLLTVIETFLESSGFKHSAIYLRDFVLSPTASELYSFLDEDSTYRHKIASISMIMNDLPNASFILVGDSGEKDPEVYSALYSTFGEQIEGIYIRNVSEETLSNERIKGLFGDYASEVILVAP